MPLRIGIDARMVGPVMTGLGRYALGLARHLPPLDPDNHYVIIRRAHGAAAFEQIRLKPDPTKTGLDPTKTGLDPTETGLDPTRTEPDPTKAGLDPPTTGFDPALSNIEETVVEGDLDQPGNLLAARALNRLGLDLYHSLYDFVPPGLTVPRIVLTLHDLTWLEQPDLCFDERFAWVKARVTNLYARATMPFAARRAARIIAVSAHTRQRGIAVLGLDPARVHVVHHGVDRQDFPAAPLAARGAPAPAEGGPERFFLCLGNSKPYKNTGAAIEAMAHLAAEGHSCRLYVTGRGDSTRHLAARARQLGIADRVTFTGPVTHERLLELLHGAVALLFPSLVEGFGLPLVESMSAGCPVIGSSAPTIAEICGDAALLPDPRSHAQIAGAMRRLLDDGQFRLELRGAGLERADRFDWRTCAAQTLAVYRSVLGEMA